MIRPFSILATFALVAVTVDSAPPIPAGPDADLPSRTDQIRAYVSLLDAHIAVTQLGWLDRSVAEAQYLRLSGRLVDLVTLAPVDDLERETYRGEIRRLEADVSNLTTERTRLLAEIERLRQFAPRQPK